MLDEVFRERMGSASLEPSPSAMPVVGGIIGQPRSNWIKLDVFDRRPKSLATLQNGAFETIRLDAPCDHASD